MKNTYIIITTIIASILSIPAFAGYYNKQDSGLSVSLSGGQIHSTTGYSSSSTAFMDFIIPVAGVSNHKNFNSRNGGVGEATIDWRASFGEKNKWNQFYVGGGLLFGLYGNTTQITSLPQTGKSNPDYLPPSKTATSQHYGGRLFIGKYFASPIYTELSLGLGGTSEAHVYSELALRLGYDVTKNMSIFTQFSAGREFQGSQSDVSGWPAFIAAENTINGYMKYRTIQVGIQFFIN